MWRQIFGAPPPRNQVKNLSTQYPSTLSILLRNIFWKGRGSQLLLIMNGVQNQVMHPLSS